jgi:putative membrane protein
MENLATGAGFITSAMHFLIAFGIGTVMFLTGLWCSMAATPQDEMKLLRESNTQTGIVMFGRIVGLMIAIAQGIRGSTGVIDLISWCLVAIVVQVAVTAIVDHIFHGRHQADIEDGKVGFSLLAAGLQVGFGILNAACAS